MSEELERVEFSGFERHGGSQIFERNGGILGNVVKQRDDYGGNVIADVRRDG